MTMATFAVTLAADKLGDWENWVAELNGPRRPSFDDMNSRLGLTEHQAFLQPTPDGNFLVLVVQDGPGSESFGTSIAESDDEFDRWFMKNVIDLHGPMPPEPTRYL
jgi:hypothetical protein